MADKSLCKLDLLSVPVPVAWERQLKTAAHPTLTPWFQPAPGALSSRAAQGLWGLKGPLYCSNTSVIFLLFFFFVGMPPIRDLVSHSPNQSG